MSTKLVAVTHHESNNKDTLETKSRKGCETTPHLKIKVKGDGLVCNLFAIFMGAN